MQDAYASILGFVKRQGVCRYENIEKNTVAFLEHNQIGKWVNRGENCNK
jgi:hypothetical protein